MQRSLAFALAAAGVAAMLAASSSGAVVPSSAQERDSGAREAYVRPQTRLVPQRQWEYMQLECIRAREALGPDSSLGEIQGLAQGHATIPS